MSGTLSQLLAGIPRPPVVQTVLSVLAPEDPILRGRTKACRNAAMPLQGLFAQDASIHRPYENLKQHFLELTSGQGNVIRELGEKIVFCLDHSFAKDYDKMAIVAMLATKFDDRAFLRQQLVQLQARH